MTDEQKTSDIEITPEMILQGVYALDGFGSDLMTPREAAAEVYRAMEIEHRRSVARKI